MPDEIRPPRNIGQVHPLNPSRDPGRRRRPKPPPPRDDASEPKRPPDDGRGRRIDDYA